MITKEGSTKIVNFILVVIVNMYFFLLINILHIHCYCVKDYGPAFLYNLMIFIYNNNLAVDMQICDLTRNQCKIFDTQVTV